MITFSDKSTLDDTLDEQLHLCGINGYMREHRFDSTRRWRFDFAWIEKMLAVECEGGTFTRGRHTRGAGFEKDCEKYNAAVLAGWRVLRFTASMIDSGDAVEKIKKALRSIS